MTVLEHLRRRPVALLCVSFTTGAAAALLLPSPANGGQHQKLLVAAAAAVVLFALLQSLRRRLRLKWPGSPLVVWTVSAFLFGMAVGQGQRVLAASEVSRLASAHLITLQGRVLTPPHRTPFGDSFRVEAREWVSGTDHRPVTGEVEVWIVRPRPGGAGSGHVRLPQEGDIATLGGVLQVITPGKSPAADGLRRLGVLSELRVGKGGFCRPTPPLHPTFADRCRAVGHWILNGDRPYLDLNQRQALAGMMFHEKQDLDADVIDDLQHTGTIHILATAGLHVGIFLGCCLGLLCFLLPRRAAVIITLVLLPGYCLACGAYPAVFRATIVAELGLLAWMLGRLPDPTTCLAIAAAGLSLGRSPEVLDPGFQLSFLTVITVLLVLSQLQDREEAPADRSRLHRWMRRFRDLVLLSLAAQIGSWPLTAYYFGIISFIGVAANLVVVPLLMAIIPLALAAGILGHLLPFAAALPGLALKALLALLLAAAHVFANLPGAWIEVSPPSPLAVAAYYLILLGGLALMSRRRS